MNPEIPGNYPPVVMRSRLVLEVASELVGRPGWLDRQARIQLRPQGGQEWNICFFGSDAPAAIDEVARGDVQIAIVNPSAVLAMAYHGAGPYPEPIPVRAITVFHQFDQLGFGVRASTGLTSLEDLRDRRYPLRVSLREQKDHSIHLVVNQVFSALGFSVDDLVSWGGEIRHDEGMPYLPHRLGAFQRGEIDAIFDEAMPLWADKAIASGMRFLSVPEPALQTLEQSGVRRAAITRDEYPGIDADVWTVDFSGWPVFTHENVSDQIITDFCDALEARRDRIPWWGLGPLPLDQMCRDTRDGPLTVPLHPAAERYWRARGYL